MSAVFLYNVEMKDFRNYYISAIKRVLKSTEDEVGESAYDAWLETGDEDYLYGDVLDSEEQLNADAYDKYLQTGNEGYLYGKNAPKGSKEHRAWAEVYYKQGYYPKNTNSDETDTPKTTVGQVQTPIEPQQPVVSQKSINNQVLKNTFNNQNNAGSNQYENPDKALTEVSNALNTTAPVNGAFSTSNMEQQKLQRTTGDFNSVTSNANPTGENGTNTPNTETSSSTNTTQPDTGKFKNEIQSTPPRQLNMNQGVVDSIKKQLEELGKEYERKESQGLLDSAAATSTKPLSDKQPMNMEEAKRELEELPKEMFKSLEIAEDGYIEEDASQLPLSAEKEKEVEQFFQPDEMVEKMDQKSLKIKQLLKSLNSLSDNEAIFKKIKNATKYAKIYNTKIASHNEKAYVVTPTLKDINTFGKRIFKVDVKKY
jgi:hypothetical protein